MWRTLILRDQGFILKTLQRGSVDIKNLTEDKADDKD